MSKRKPVRIFEDMIDSIDKIFRYVDGLSEEEFLSNDLVLDGVARNLEIIGEAANRVPESIKNNYNYINWRQIIGLRNKIIHDYENIKYTTIWKIIKETLPTFRIQIAEIKDNPDFQQYYYL